MEEVFDEGLTLFAGLNAFPRRATLTEKHLALLDANLAIQADIAAIEAGMDALHQETRADNAGVKAEILK